MWLGEGLDTQIKKNEQVSGWGHQLRTFLMGRWRLEGAVRKLVLRQLHYQKDDDVHNILLFVQTACLGDSWTSARHQWDSESGEFLKAGQ